MKKRIISLLLALVLACGMAPAALAAEGLENFQKVNTYTPGQFTDVDAGAWYASSVQAAYEYGLVKGSSATAFNPTGTISVAETLALAARIHSTYYANGVDLTQGDPWYQVYVDYAMANGILTGGMDYTATATRQQFASILAASLPESALGAINSITAIPDVPSDPAVYRLYNAGILTGSDSAGTFNPGSTIQRSEVAAIVTRMADTTQRKTFTLSAAPAQPAQPETPAPADDGELTLEKLQGTWQLHNEYGNTREITYSGNKMIYVCYVPSEGYYLYNTASITFEKRGDQYCNIVGSGDSIITAKVTEDKIDYSIKYINWTPGDTVYPITDYSDTWFECTDIRFEKVSSPTIYNQMRAVMDRVEAKEAEAAPGTGEQQSTSSEYTLTRAQAYNKLLPLYNKELDATEEIVYAIGAVNYSGIANEFGGGSDTKVAIEMIKLYNKVVAAKSYLEEKDTGMLAICDQAPGFEDVKAILLKIKGCLDNLEDAAKNFSQMDLDTLFAQFEQSQAIIDYWGEFNTTMRGIYNQQAG